MPLEGHYERQTTPLYALSSREIRAAGAVLAVTLLALMAVVLATAGDSGAPVKPGCFSASVAGIVGAQTVSACGAEAEARCAHAARYDDPRSRTIVAACEEQGIPTTGKPGWAQPSDPIQ
ncbi:MAG TPA: hypothetical protein VFK14_12110 [Solirubrobacterales bacterium]|nr:hypothetical protein [Solirubrobacterales bacterium]